MRFSRQEYWSGLPCHPPGDLPDPGIEPVSPESPAWLADSLPLSHWGSPLRTCSDEQFIAPDNNILNLIVLSNSVLKYLLTQGQTSVSLLWGSLWYLRGFPCSSVKNLSAMQETWVRFLGWEDPLDKEIATHSGILAWRIPWTEEPDRLQSMGSQESDEIWRQLHVLPKTCLFHLTYFSIISTILYETWFQVTINSISRSIYLDILSKQFE